MGEINGGDIGVVIFDEFCANPVITSITPEMEECKRRLADQTYVIQAFEDTAYGELVKMLNTKGEINMEVKVASFDPASALSHIDYASISSVLNKIDDMCAHANDQTIIELNERMLERGIMLRSEYERLFTIEKVIFNDPATIVYWADGTRTVVKCQKGDVFNKETGFALCCMKKIYGNNNHFNKLLHMFIKED